MPTLHLIDAFTAVPFAGNPAGVCWLDAPAPDAWMQSVALEMNQAETAFLRAEDDEIRLRWFTPAYEVDLCGHATLASAHFLWETTRLGPDVVARFRTRSGLLTAERSAEGITLDFPATPPVPTTPPAGLLPALGIETASVLINQVAQPDYLVVTDSAARVRELVPNMAGLTGFPCRGVIVTAPGDRKGLDFVSRFFGPAAGVPEDPVTGSAHCTLGPYWGGRLGQTAMVGYQASARGGTVRVQLAGQRVRLTGQAVTVLQGTIAPPA